MQSPIFPNLRPFDIGKLRSFRKIAIRCPAMPDADTVAAGFALHEFFSASGTAPFLYYPGDGEITEPGLLEMLSYLNIPLCREPDRREWDGLLIQVGGAPEYERPTATAKTVIIGVHKSSAPLPCEHDIRPHLTACSTLVWDLLRNAEFSFDKALAAGLIYGLHAVSNGFSEIRFPLDRDMVDTLPFDNALFQRLKRSVFRIEDLYHAAEALHGLERHHADGVLLVNVLPCESGILRFLSDLALRVHGIDLSLAFYESSSGTRFALSSGTREIKASDLVRRLVAEGDGHGGGDHEKGGGVVRGRSSAQTNGSLLSFFRDAVNRYRNNYDILDCLAEKPPVTGTLRAYQKLPVVQGFVRCSRIFPKRSRLLVRMLEGDIALKVSPQTYLLIGLAGEVYPVEREIFEKNYVTSDTLPVLDVPYTPAVICDGERVELIEHIEGCIAREGRVLARQLSRGIKVFTRWDTESYLLGEPGDWLVRRKENSRDVYIVKEPVFPRIYTAVRP